MGFAPFGIGLLMGLLTLTAYACCAAGDDRPRLGLADRNYNRIWPFDPLPLYLGKGSCMW